MEEQLVALAMEQGAHRVGCVSTCEVRFEPAYRKLCESNACGNYGKNWMCPPYAGEVEALIVQAKQFPSAVVYQTVWEIEDSYDFEGMMLGGRQHNELARRLGEAYAKLPLAKTLHLGAGGCQVCEECAKRREEPCRHPSQAMPSLETYGIAVAELAALAGMPYMHGPNTVTYFGAYFYGE